MKNIEDKLDGFEQVLAILVKKISVLESLLIDPKVPVDELARQMLVEIQASLTKMPSGNMMISELIGIRKRIDALSYAQENPKPVALNLRAKGYFVSLAVLLSATVVSLATLKYSYHEFERYHRTAARYEVAQRISPRLTSMIDNAFNHISEPSIDSLRHAWESLDIKARNLESSKRRRR